MIVRGDKVIMQMIKEVRGVSQGGCMAEETTITIKLKRLAVVKVIIIFNNDNVDCSILLLSTASTANRIKSARSIEGDDDGENKMKSCWAIIISWVAIELLTQKGRWFKKSFITKQLKVHSYGQPDPYTLGR